MIKIKMPDITPAQIAAIIGWVAAQAVAYGWLTTEQSQLVMSAGATIVAASWKLADAFLRGKRNQRYAYVTAAQIAASPNSTVMTDPTGFTGTVTKNP